MRSFLASIPLSGQTVVVVGGGEMGLAKARLAASTPATLRWFTPDETPAPLAGPAKAPEPVARTPEAADFAGARLAFIAIHDEAEAARLGQLARAAGALVNVVDRPDLCDFQTPALVDRGDVVIGIATGGAAPILARDIRAKIEAMLPKGLEQLAALSRDLRDTVKANAPGGIARRRFWETAFRGKAARLALDGDVAGARREILRSLNTPVEPTGAVWIVGAGPGDPDLLTLKALRVLQDADVIVHDRLVPEAVLDLARRDARRIYVGKAKSNHAVEQRDIEAILIAEARAGHRVVRLKGGDPFVFGRGGEELQALKAAGVEAHVVPGVTAAAACAASAGVPLTHRDHAQAVTLMTGQPKKGGEEIDWAALSSDANTLAVYMGVGTAGRISGQLIAAGRDASTPVAIVENGTLPTQRVISGVLAELPLLIEAFAVEGPAILFIGATAAFADGLRLPRAAVSSHPNVVRQPSSFDRLRMRAEPEVAATASPIAPTAPSPHPELVEGRGDAGAVAEAEAGDTKQEVAA